MSKFKSLFKANTYQGWGTRDQIVAENGGEWFTATRFTSSIGPATSGAAFSGRMGLATVWQRFSWIVYDDWTGRIVSHGTETSWKKANLKAHAVIQDCVKRQMVIYTG